MGCSGDFSDFSDNRSYRNEYRNNNSSRNSYYDKKSEDKGNQQSNNNNNDKFGFGFGSRNDNDNNRFGFGSGNDNDNRWGFHNPFNVVRDNNDYENNIRDHYASGDNDRMFNDVDRDNNSVLSKNEIMDGFNLNSRQADELMDKMDENRDGYVDKDEFNNFMRYHF